MIVTIVALFLLLGVFARARMSAQAWVALACAVFGVTLLLNIFSGGFFGALLSLLLFAGNFIALLFFRAAGLRKKFVSGRVRALIRKTMPPVSQTEREAIAAGGVGWDAELFSGAPDWEKLFSANKAMLSEAERDFLDGPVEELCAMCDDWAISENGELPPQVWAFIRDNGFFGMNASAEYGGLGFSAYAQSCVVQKLASRSGSVAVVVMVPNSLGPAELIEHYGDSAQKEKYLRRLAEGVDTPCFALTGPWSGSDAAAMPDTGVLCEDEQDGARVLGFRLNWDKRYITLGPVSTLIGLAFKAYDPQGLLGGGAELGITCALVPADARGVTIGARHLPLRSAFPNGPNRGADVFIPLEQVIGGRDGIGRGWRMLMESLAAGRGISLPAMAAGGAKLSARYCGAYARVREQFGIAIGKFEGVEEVLARIGGLTYLLDSARVFMCAALDAGEKPAVMSAMVKLHCTELSRQVINDAMDLHGGKAICTGPRNYLAAAYAQIPLGITVEGANILTRTLIVFGQGALRCHPYLLDEIETAGSDEEDAADTFDKLFRAHAAHMSANKIRSTALALSRARLARGYGGGLIKEHTRALEKLSANFAFLADAAMLFLGGEMKRREMLAGRFADALGNMFLASCALKKFHDDGEQVDDAPLADWACRYALYHAQHALDQILRNFPHARLGKLMRVNIFGGGRHLQLPPDSLSKKVAAILQTDAAARDRLCAHMFLPADENDAAAQLESAFNLMNQSGELRRRLKKEGREPAPLQSHAEWLDSLRAESVVTEEEANLLARTRNLAAEAIRVDEFAHERSTT